MGVLFQTAAAFVGLVVLLGARFAAAGEAGAFAAAVMVPGGSWDSWQLWATKFSTRTPEWALKIRRPARPLAQVSVRAPGGRRGKPGAGVKHRDHHESFAGDPA